MSDHYTPIDKSVQVDFEPVPAEQDRFFDSSTPRLTRSVPPIGLRRAVTREHLAAEVKVFTHLVKNLAETISLVDFCYWRKAIEDTLEYGQRRLYERYE